MYGYQYNGKGRGHSLFIWELPKLVMEKTDVSNRHGTGVKPYVNQV